MKYTIELTEKELDIVIMAIEMTQGHLENHLSAKEWDLLWDTKIKIHASYQQNPKYS